MEKLQTKEFYEFGAFQIDVRNRLLFRGGEPVGLNLKEFEVLLFLVVNAGEVVEKDALLTNIWHETFVEEATLARNISRLRKKLEREGADKIIETLPKRGYRFLPAVTRREQTAAAPAVFVEEETVRRMRVEETISLTPEEFQAANFNGANNGEVLTNGAAKALLSPAAENPPSAIRHPPSAIALARRRHRAGDDFFRRLFLFSANAAA